MQYKLGEMYYNGDGVSKSVVSAYLWVSAAANNGYKPAPGTRDEVAKEMTAEQIAEAKARLASIEWDKGRGLNQ